MAILLEIWLKESLRLLKLGNLLVLLEKFRHVVISGHEVIRDDFDDTQDRGLVEIADECLCLLWHRQVVTAREDVGNLVFLLHETVEPKVLAETHLRHQLPVRGEMVVELVRFEVFR